MSRLTRTGTIVVAIAQLAVLLPAAAAAEGIFPDKNLEAVVRRYVFAKRENKEPLTADDVRTISTIEAKGREIEDLTGLDKCTQLALLDLENSRISNLAPLSGLENLQSLNLAQNQIEDLAPLSKLIRLQYLHLAGNQVADVAPLANLTNLTALYLSGNRIKDIGPLAKLTRLWSLYLDGNQVTDIKTLSNLKHLSSLDLAGNGLRDLSPLSACGELSYLMLKDNQIRDLGPLVAMARKDAEGDKRFAPYWRLYLSGNPIGDVGQIDALQKIGGRVHFDGAVAAPAVGASGNLAVLQPLVGEWKARVKFWADPDSEPSESTGTASRKMILQGRYLEERFASGTLSGAFEGIGLIGYDAERQRFTSIWVDSASPAIQSGSGTYDAAKKVLTRHVQNSDPQTAGQAKQRWVLRIESNDKQVLEVYYYYSGAGGAEVKRIEVTYERSK